MTELSQQDNKARMQIADAISDFAPSITIDATISSDDVRCIIRTFMRNHPEIFWFSNQYHYDEQSGILKLKYNFSKEKAAFFNQEIEKVIVQDFQIEHVKTLSEIERLAYVYKWIVNRTVYNEYSSFNQTIYSTLINRNSVCTGYAKTAQYLLDLIDIESQLLFGKFRSDKSEYGRHGWNIVKINGKWYHVDFCLADKTLSHLLNKNEAELCENSILWNYFGVSTDKILSNRTIEDIESLPECNDALPITDVEIISPEKRLICCKSDAGTSSYVYLNSFNKYTVIKIPRNDKSNFIPNEATALEALSDCRHTIKSYGLSDKGLELEYLTPWSELLNSHYYTPNESDLKDLLNQLIEGLIECRDRGITYSDIHYNNVFVSKDGTYKWGDFGISFQNRADGQLPPEMIGVDGKPKGSRWFMAPETYYQNIFTEASAIYSVAMMAYFAMNNMHPPFWIDDEHKNEALAQRLYGRTIPRPIFADRYKNIWPIISRLLAFSANIRPRTFENCLTLLSSKLGFGDCRPVGSIISCDSAVNGCSDDTYAKTIAPTSDKLDIITDSDTFACTCGGREDMHGAYCCPPPSSDAQEQISARESYGVIKQITKAKRSFWSRVFGKKEKAEMINASAYAPAEIIPRKHFIVRVFIHKPEESHDIDMSVKDIDKTAVKKANKPLDMPVSIGDKIKIQLPMTDGVLVDEPIQNTTWRGHYVECDFGCKLTQENLYSVLGKAIVTINDVPHGDLKFTIDVVSDETPTIYAPVDSKRYSKIFISYAHADYPQVRGIAEGCKMNGSDYFFDRHTLQAGDIFKEKILQYIDSADLFVLCWSKNAAESEWVQLERKHALKLIEQENNQLTIYPLSMPPEAPLPEDMSDKYNFATL